MIPLRAAALAAVAASLALSACTARPLALPPTPTPLVPQFCRLRTDGRWITDGAGKAVILHGMTLPTFKAMGASDRSPEQRLEELAAAGARVVRVPVEDPEITPSFVPATLSPFIDRANALGMLVIVSFQNDPRTTVNSQADEADDFLRLMMTYLRGAPGVWFEPIGIPIDSPKWAGIAQRITDIARGFNADNVLLFGNPAWLRDGPGPLTGANVVYGVPALEGWPLDAAPLIVLDYDGADPGAVEAAQVSTLARDGAITPALSALWKQSRPGCPAQRVTRPAT